MPTPKRNTRTNTAEHDALSAMKVLPLSIKEASCKSPRNETDIPQIIHLHPPTPGRKTTKVTYSKLVAVPDVSECAHAAQASIPVIKTKHSNDDASECARTPTDSPRRTLAERGPLAADCSHF